MELARAEMLGAVEGDQQPPAQPLERRQRVAFGERRQALHEQPVERRRRRPVEHRADVIVARDGGDPEQRLAVRAPVPFGEGALMRQKGGAAHEEQREGRGADIRHGIGALHRRPPALVRKAGADLSQLRYQALQRAHARVESCPRAGRKPKRAGRKPKRAGRKPKTARPARPSQKTCGAWQIRLNRTPKRASLFRMRLARVENRWCKP
jgi:hypothetical protein